jgi:hypothetical protein
MLCQEISWPITMLFRCGGVRDFSKRVKPGDGRGQWPDWRRYFRGNKSQGAPLSICVWPQNEGDTKRISLGKDIVMGIKEHSGTGRSGILGHS